MAFPKNLAEIHTNIPSAELAEVVKAVKENKIDWIPWTSYVCIGSTGGEFNYKGARYQLTEYFEEVARVVLIRSEQGEFVLSRVNIQYPFQKPPQ